MRQLRQRLVIPSKVPIEKMVNWLTKIALIVLSPFILIGVFWVVDIQNSMLILLPVLGILCLVLGGSVGILFAKALRVDRQRTGAMFTSGSFSNWGSFGTLLCFMMLGEQSLVFVALFRLVEEFVYYTIGFPIAKTYGMVDKIKERRRTIIFRILKDPFIIAAFSAIFIGGLLNISTFERPEFYPLFINFIVPFYTFMLVISVGYNMRFTAIKGYLKEIFAISIAKYVIVPVSIVAISYAIGLGSLYDGMVIKVILILTAMPPAFISLIPPKLYGLDVDLANSSFLINTALLLFVVPLLYLVIQFM